jgi:hypothetical protein
MVHKNTLKFVLQRAGQLVLELPPVTEEKNYEKIARIYELIEIAEGIVWERKNG